MKNEMVKVYIDKKLWNDKVLMDLTALAQKKENEGKVIFTTQKFKFDMATLAVTVGAAILCFFLGALIF